MLPFWRTRKERLEDAKRATEAVARRDPGEVARMQEGFLAELVAERPGQVEEPAPGELSQAGASVLVKAVLEPDKHETRIYSDLGFHPAQGKAAVDELEARGFVRLNRLPRKGRGGRYVVLEVLAGADGELARRGIKRPERVLKGGYRHDVYGRWLGRWAVEQGYRHWFERTLGAKQFDFVYERKDGSLVAVEVCLTGTAQWNAEQAMKALAVEGISELVMACEEQKFAKELEKAMKECDKLGLYKERLRVCLLSEFFEE